MLSETNCPHNCHHTTKKAKMKCYNTHLRKPSKNKAENPRKDSEHQEQAMLMSGINDLKIEKRPATRRYNPEKAEEKRLHEQSLIQTHNVQEKLTLEQPNIIIQGMKSLHDCNYLGDVEQEENGENQQCSEKHKIYEESILIGIEDKNAIKSNSFYEVPDHLYTESLKEGISSNLSVFIDNSLAKFLASSKGENKIEAQRFTELNNLRPEDDEELAMESVSSSSSENQEEIKTVMLNRMGKVNEEINESDGLQEEEQLSNKSTTEKATKACHNHLKKINDVNLLEYYDWPNYPYPLEKDLYEDVSESTIEEKTEWQNQVESLIASKSPLDRSLPKAKYLHRRNVYHSQFKYDPKAKRNLRRLSEHDEKLLEKYENNKIVLPITHSFQKFMGWGCSASRRIKKHEFLGWYNAVVIPFALAERSGMKEYCIDFTHDNREPGDFVICAYGDKWSFGPIFNHQPKGKANVETFMIYTSRGLEIHFRALEEIPAGTYLCWNYNSGEDGLSQFEFKQKMSNLNLKDSVFKYDKWLKNLTKREQSPGKSIYDIDSICIYAKTSVLALLSPLMCFVQTKRFERITSMDLDDYTLGLVSVCGFEVYVPAIKKNAILEELQEYKVLIPSKSKHLLSCTSMKINTEELANILYKVGIDKVRVIGIGMKMSAASRCIAELAHYLIPHEKNRIDVAYKDFHETEIHLYNLAAAVNALEVNTSMRRPSYFPVFSDDFGTLAFTYKNYRFKSYESFIHHFKSIIKDPKDDGIMTSKQLRRKIGYLQEYAKITVPNLYTRYEISMTGALSLEKIIEQGVQHLLEASAYLKTIPVRKLTATQYKEICSEAVEQFHRNATIGRNNDLLTNARIAAYQNLLKDMGYSSFTMNFEIKNEFGPRGFAKSRDIVDEVLGDNEVTEKKATEEVDFYVSEVSNPKGHLKRRHGRKKKELKGAAKEKVIQKARKKREIQIEKIQKYGRENNVSCKCRICAYGSQPPCLCLKHNLECTKKCRCQNCFIHDGSKSIKK